MYAGSLLSTIVLIDADMTTSQAGEESFIEPTPRPSDEPQILPPLSHTGFGLDAS